MARAKPVELTQRIAERAVAQVRSAGGEGEAWIMDAKVGGLGIRVRRASGVAAWYLRTYGKRGKALKLLIGPFENVSVAEARQAADVKLYELRTSTTDSRLTARENRLRSFGDVATEYLELLEERGRTAKHIANMRGCMEAHVLPKVGELPMLDVTRRHAERVIYPLQKAQPALANRVRAALTAVFSLALTRGYVATNPVLGVEKAQEEPRRRVLTEEESARLLAILHGPMMREDRWRDAAAALLLVLLTTSRPGELLKARWQDIDLERGVWVKPAATTKTRRLHTVALSSAAVGVFRHLQGTARAADGFVFPSRKGAADGHRTVLKRPWAEACRRAGITGARIYDLRRTSATRLLESGADLATVMRAGNWSTPAVLLRVYAQPSLEVQRGAVEGLFRLPEGGD